MTLSRSRLPRRRRAGRLPSALAVATIAAASPAAASADPAPLTPEQEAFLLTLPTSVTQTTTGPATAPTPAFCPRFNVVVARGTEQTPNQDEGLDGRAYRDAAGTLRAGPTSAKGIWWQLAAELYFPAPGGGHTPLVGREALLRTDVTYPAVNWFPGSTPIGTGNVISYLNRTNRLCPQTRFVLLGYSQGAAAIGDALSVPSKRIMWLSGIAQLTTEATNAIASVGFIGNPGFNRRRTGSMNAGTFSPTLSGVAPRHLAAFPVRSVPSPLPAGTRASEFAVNPGLTEGTADKIRDFCKARDYICQWGSLSSTVSMHLSYKDDDAPRADLLAHALERLEPLR